MMNWRTGSWSGKKIATAPPPRSEPTRAPAQGSIDAGADPGQASRKTHGNFRGFWTHSAFLKQHHQPLQAEVAPWPKGPRPKTPPPSISMHPASMLTLDQRSSTWKPKISRFFRKFADRRIGLYPWAKTDNWLPKKFLSVSKKRACLNPVNPKISEPNRAGLGRMRRSKRPQLTIFQLYSNQQHWFPQKWNLIIRSCQSYLIRLNFWNRNISKIISILRVCDCNICSLIFFITP